uniref:AraC family ligand binding domain-containing protein n=2 Tax=Pseudomonas TaxID=286 RepID=UPI00186A6DAA
MNGQQENARLWPARGLGGVELLHARYRRQRFAPHVHEGYVFTVIERGAQRFRHRGAEHLAATGSMVLINPDELHTGATAVEEGWQYRGFYPTLGQL